MPIVVRTLLGTGATVGVLLLLFMAVTSTVSSSIIAVSSILSFNIYRTYINPQASDKKIVRVSHFGVVAHGIFIAGFSLALSYGGVDMNGSIISLLC
jgi:Na+/proline symporter